MAENQPKVVLMQICTDDFTLEGAMTSDGTFYIPESEVKRITGDDLQKALICTQDMFSCVECFITPMGDVQKFMLLTEFIDLLLLIYSMNTDKSYFNKLRKQLESFMDIETEK